MKGLRDLEDLPVAQAQRPYLLAGNDALDVKTLQVRLGAGFDLLPGKDPEPPRGLAGQVQILRDGQIGDKAQLLVHDDNLVPHPFHGVVDHDLTVKYGYGSGVRPVNPAEDLHQRGFSGPVFPDETVDLPDVPTEGDVIQRHGFSEPL